MEDNMEPPQTPQKELLCNPVVHKTNEAVEMSVLQFSLQYYCKRPGYLNKLTTETFTHIQGCTYTHIKTEYYSTTKRMKFYHF